MLRSILFLKANARVFARIEWKVSWGCPSSRAVNWTCTFGSMLQGPAERLLFLLLALYFRDFNRRKWTLNRKKNRQKSAHDSRNILRRVVVKETSFFQRSIFWLARCRGNLHSSFAPILIEDALNKTWKVEYVILEKETFASLRKRRSHHMEWSDFPWRLPDIGSNVWPNLSNNCHVNTLSYLVKLSFLFVLLRRAFSLGKKQVWIFHPSFLTG